MDSLILLFNQIHVDSVEYPAALALILLPLIYFALVRVLRGRFLQRIFLPSLEYQVTAGNLLGKEGFTVRRQNYRMLIKSRRLWLTAAAALLMALGYVFLSISLARPYGGAVNESRTEGIDIYFALDMSASMKAYDYSLSDMQARYAMNVETENRFDVARSTISDFVRSRQLRCKDHSGAIARCDRVGVTMFGQHAFIAVPLTTDYDAVISHLARRRIDDIDASQSAIGDGLLASVASLRHSESKSKNIVLVSDGNRSGGRVSVGQAVLAAKEYGVRVYPILIGAGDKAVLAQKNYDGYMSFHETLFPVNFQLLNDIARETGGVAYKAAKNDDFQKELAEILEDLEPHVSVDRRHENQLDLSRHFVFLSFMATLLGFSICLVFCRRFP